MPSAILRSANSVTTMAPSTSRPTASTRENSTTVFRVRPRAASTRIPNRKDVGMAVPTSRADRAPRVTMIRITTRVTAVIRLFCNCETWSTTKTDWSWEKKGEIPAGQFSAWRLVTSLTRSTVSRMLAPTRLVTSRPMAGLPFRRAMDVRSLKVRRMVATSDRVTTASPWTFRGRSRMSCAVSSRPGTLTGKRPWPVSSVPAATRRLLRPTRSINVSCEIL